MEAVNKENFKNTCPGKMEYCEFMNKLTEATEH